MMKLSKIVTLGLLAMLVSTGCGSKSDTTPTATTTGSRNTTDVFGTPANFSVTADVHSVLIKFDRNSAATGYKLYFGTSPALVGLGTGYVASPFSTNGNNITMGDLTNGTTYYFAVSAVDSSGAESVKTAVANATPVAAQ